MNIAWLIAEFIGTFTLIFIGAGSICLEAMNPGSLGLAGIAIAHGLAIAVMVSAVAHISGGKLNPAISLGLVIGKKLDIKTALFEILAQLAGAVCAAFLLTLVFPSLVVKAAQLGTPNLGPEISPWMGILGEAILTFFLVFTVYGTLIDPKGSFKAIGGFGIGCAIIFGILALGGVTGAAINPARAFGPALISGEWSHHYVYWIGPILGGLLAGLLYSTIMLKKNPNEN